MTNLYIVHFLNPYVNIVTIKTETTSQYKNNTELVKNIKATSLKKFYNNLSKENMDCAYILNLIKDIILLQLLNQLNYG